MDRRSFLKVATGAGMAALLPRLARAQQASPAAKAKSIIVLWMNGGPSHLDTWDPKPGTKNGGPFKAIKTAQKDLMLPEHMPGLAKVADKLAVLRGLATKEGNHQRAQYLMHTGYAPNPTVVHPALGAWVSHELGPTASKLPAFVSLNGPSAGGGFLGPQHGPFVIPQAGALPTDVRAVTDDARFQRRLSLLDALEEDFEKRAGPQVSERRALYAEATRLMSAPALEAFEIAKEPEAVRKAYGDTPFGKGCLVARRLVEAGVRTVEVVLDGWDTHQNNFERVQKLLGQVDPAMSTLVSDLEARGKLASTLVVWMGDFGRTPRINANDGRDHWPQAQACVLAGAGIKPGTYGATNAEGEKPVGNGFGVPDVMATIVSLAGLAPSKELVSPVGRPIGVTDSGRVLHDVLL